MIIYGIKNCDTMKKAFIWLDENGIDYSFHDYKKHGISRAKIQEWLKKVSLNELINKKGVTFKKLTESEQKATTDTYTAIGIMMDKTSMIKRPILEGDNLLLIGFNPDEWIKALK
jgi:arsenate reductase